MNERPAFGPFRACFRGLTALIPGLALAILVSAPAEAGSNPEELLAESESTDAGLVVGFRSDPVPETHEHVLGARYSTTRADTPATMSFVRTAPEGSIAPEPGSLILMIAGLLILSFWVRRSGR